MDYKKNDLSSYPYISSYTFRLICSQGWLSTGDYQYCKGNINSLKNGIYPEDIKFGDKIYVVTEYLDEYFKKIHPKIKNNYILITGRCDRGIDKKIINYLDDKIIHWFSTNVECEHPKITQIPLGIQNRHWRMRNHPQSDIELLNDINHINFHKETDVLLSFQIHTNTNERKKCFDYFKGKNFVKIRNYTSSDRLDREFVKNYFMSIKKSKFVICPFGGGFDCHRNWEVFSLGSYPIIKKHKSMENFYDMPAWFVDDWSEVNEKVIQDKYNELNCSIKNKDKIYFDYWNNVIEGVLTENE